MTPDALRATAERVEREVEHMTGWGGEPDLGAALTQAARCARLVADMMEPSEALVVAVAAALAPFLKHYPPSTAGARIGTAARAALKAATQGGGE